MSTIELTVPRGFSEMTEKNLRYLAALQMHGESEESIRTKCFIRFSGIRPITGNDERYWFVKPRLKGVFSMTPGEVAYFSDKMDWLTSNYIGVNPVKIGRFRPCDKWMRDTKFIQYLDAENHYQAFLFTKDEKHLYSLMATLYQPGASYSNEKTSRFARKLSRKATEEEKIIVTMWMMGMKQYFTRFFKYLFISSGNELPEHNTPPNMHEIITSQVRALSGGDVTKESAVLQSNTWSALTELNEKCRESEELKKQTN